MNYNQNKMKKFRASYSVLQTWQSGNWERAIEMYFKLADFVTPAMLDGRNLHKKWEEHIKNTNTLPVEFGSKKLNKPVVEGKRVTPINEWLDLVTVIDCYDSPILYEWKSGKSSSESYANSKQIGIYGWSLKLEGIEVDRAYIYHYDQYKKTSDMSIVHLTDRVIKDSEEWVMTLASEVHNYFTENDLYNRLGKK